LVVPTASAPEAAVVEGVEVIAVSSLAQAVAFFTGAIEIDPTPPASNEWFEEYAAYDVDFADVRGQEMAKRAVTIAAAGNHNLLMLGPHLVPAKRCSPNASRRFSPAHRRRID
jgi:magnesium chelatase family protein